MYRRNGNAALRRRLALAAVIAALVAGSGGGDSVGAGDSVGDEAKGVLSDLESLQPGEIVIKGLRPPRLSGPYDFRPGGYVLSFEQSASDGIASRLRVSLESEPNTRRDPYELVVDTTKLAGKADVHSSGKLYVNVHSAGAPFVLRFTPSQ